MLKLKTFFLTIFLLLITAYPAMAAPSVTADNTTFDILSGVYKLTGHVQVKTDRFTVLADKAQVNLMSFEVWAQGNIRCHYTAHSPAIDFSGEKLYGSWDKKTIDVKGATKFVSDGLTITANETSFNWDTKIVHFAGDVTLKEADKVEHYAELNYDVQNNKIISPQTVPEK